jgi:hypothetical protein
MNTEEVGAKVAELVRQQEYEQAIDTLYADDIVSVEAQGHEGMPAEMHGIEHVRGKTKWWISNMEVHSIEVGGVFAAHDKFVLRYDIDVTDKASKKRMRMSEVGIYTVKSGKIVREEFLPLVEAKA